MAANNKNKQQNSAKNKPGKDVPVAGDLSVPSACVRKSVLSSEEVE